MFPVSHPDDDHDHSQAMARSWELGGEPPSILTAATHNVLEKDAPLGYIYPISFDHRNE
jgi:hypothetical protein